MWNHWYPPFQISDDSTHEFQSQGGSVLFCHLCTMIPRVISGCWDQASNLDRSPVRQTQYHYASLIRLEYMTVPIFVTHSTFCVKATRPLQYMVDADIKCLCSNHKCACINTYSYKPCTHPPVLCVLIQ